MQGRKTHEQFERIIHKDVNTRNGGQNVTTDKTLDEARREIRRPERIYDIETGDRSIKRGTHQETAHTKHRTDE